METRKSFFKTPLLIASLGLVMACAVACGDDDDDSNPAPNGGSKAMGGTGGTSGTAGKGSGGSSNNTAGQKSDAGEGNSPATMGGSDGGGGEPTKNQAGNGPGAGGGGPDQDCSDEAEVGCFCGKPSSLKEFFNACPTTGCEPFDNSKLTSLPASGVLPDLP